MKGYHLLFLFYAVYVLFSKCPQFLRKDKRSSIDNI